MQLPQLTPGAVVALGALGIGALYLMRNQTSNIAAGAVGAVADAGAGAVLGIGDVIGIPRTNETQCQADLKAGRLWDASFSCPAGTFIGGAWDSLWREDAYDRAMRTAEQQPATWGREARTSAPRDGIVWEDPTNPFYLQP